MDDLVVEEKGIEAARSRIHHTRGKWLQPRARVTIRSLKLVKVR